MLSNLRGVMRSLEAFIIFTGRPEYLFLSKAGRLLPIKCTAAWDAILPRMPPEASIIFISLFSAFFIPGLDKFYNSHLGAVRFSRTQFKHPGIAPLPVFILGSDYLKKLFYLRLPVLEAGNHVSPSSQATLAGLGYQFFNKRPELLGLRLGGFYFLPHN